MRLILIKYQYLQYSPMSFLVMLIVYAITKAQLLEGNLYELLVSCLAPLVLLVG